MAEGLSEQRYNSRFAYANPFTCLIMGDIAHPPDKSSIQGGIVDISNGGMGIYAGKKLAEGAIMLVRVPVAGTEASIPTLAAVQWVKKNCNGYYAGLKFVME